MKDNLELKVKTTYNLNLPSQPFNFFNYEYIPFCQIRHLNIQFNNIKLFYHIKNQQSLIWYGGNRRRKQNHHKNQNSSKESKMNKPTIQITSFTRLE